MDGPFSCFSGFLLDSNRDCDCDLIWPSDPALSSPCKTGQHGILCTYWNFALLFLLTGQTLSDSQTKTKEQVASEKTEEGMKNQDQKNCKRIFFALLQAMMMCSRDCAVSSYKYDR